jgi:hypothetical protein
VKIGTQLKFGSAILILLLGVTLSCTRSISVPVSPNIVPSGSTITSTATSSPTQTATQTPTPTGQNTPTNTPSNTPSSTFTPTASWTPSPTGQATATNTPTNTPSGTPTTTPTNTGTSTPTTNPDIIADFKEGGLQDVTTNGLGLSGYWGPVTSVGTSATTALVTGAGPSGCSSGNYASIGGTTGSATPVYAELGGSFLNPTANYDISTSAPANTNAFVFCIKSSTLTQVWFAVADAATSASSAYAGENINVSNAWQSVTVCFDQMQSPSWAPSSITGHVFDPATAENFVWETTAASTAYDIEISSFQFAQVPAGNCPALTATPTPNPLIIDAFPTNSNQVNVINGRGGYWFCYSDLGVSGTFGSAVAMSSANAISVVSGETAASNPISIQYNGTVLNSGTIASGTVLVWGISTTNTGNGGVSQFTSSDGAVFQMANPGDGTDPYCAYFTGIMGAGCSGNDLLGAYSQCPYAGAGFNFTDPKAVYNINTYGYTGISFYAKVDANSTTNNWYMFLPTSDTACPTCDNDNFGFTFTPSTTWTQYGTSTLFTAYAQAYSDGGADGASVNPANAYGVQWQNSNSGPATTYGLYIDDVYFY